MSNRSILAIPTFRRLAIGWTFSNFGDSALYLTLAIWVKDLTGSDASAGLVFLFLGLPAFLAPVAGHIADRFSRRRLVVASNLVAALGVMTLTFVDNPGDLWIVYAVTFGYGLLTYLTSACGSGLIKDLVPDEQLASANGLLNALDQGLRMISPLVGAALFAAFGGVAVGLLTASSLVIAAAVVASLRMEETPPTVVSERASFRMEFTAGFRHILTTRGLARLTLWLAIATGITGLANTTIFAAIDQGLGLGSEFFAVLASLQGVGSILGGLSAAFIIGRITERTTMAMGLVLLGIGMATAVTTNAALMLVGSFVVGVAVPWTYVSFSTIRQRATPGELQGRVSAATNLAINGPQTFGTALGAIAIGFVHYQMLIVAMGATVLTCGFLTFRTPVPPPATRRESQRNDEWVDGAVTAR